MLKVIVYCFMDRGLCLAIFWLQMTVGVGLCFWVEYTRPPTPTVTFVAGHFCPAFPTN